MGFLKKASEKVEPQPQPRPSVPSAPKQEAPRPRLDSATLIARPAKIKGDLTGGGDVRVDGEVEGKIAVEGKLTISQTGKVRGELNAKLVVVAGTVEGNVSASEKIELAPTAKLVGDITAPRILIQEGASFEGQVHMRQPSGSSKKDQGKRQRTPSQGQTPHQG